MVVFQSLHTLFKSERLSARSLLEIWPIVTAQTLLPSPVASALFQSQFWLLSPLIWFGVLLLLWKSLLSTVLASQKPLLTAVLKSTLCLMLPGISIVILPTQMLNELESRGLTVPQQAATRSSIMKCNGLLNKLHSALWALSPRKLFKRMVSRTAKLTDSRSGLGIKAVGVLTLKKCRLRQRKLLMLQSILQSMRMWAQALSLSWRGKRERLMVRHQLKTMSSTMMTVQLETGRFSCKTSWISTLQFHSISQKRINSQWRRGVPQVTHLNQQTFR